MSTIVHYLNILCSAKMQDSDNMQVHLDRMEDLFDKLDAAGQNLEESLQIAMIFRSVPSSYRSLVQSLQSRADEDWTVTLVKTRLLDEYNQRCERDESLSQSVKAMKMSASDREEPVCFFCRKPGHFKKQCKKWLSQKNASGSGKKKAKDDNHKAKQAKSDNSAVCFVAGEKLPKSWVIDSGASRHMTCDRSFFVELNPSGDSKVTLADGKNTKVHGIGKGVLFGEDGSGKRVEITLSDVLFVPDLDGGLLSVGQLAAKGFAAVFGASLCEIKDPAGDTVVVGDKVGGLYRLRLQERSLRASCEHHQRCQHTWHRRMGHRDPEVIRQLERDDLVSGLNITDCGMRITCECCLKGKLARQPFPRVTEKSGSTVRFAPHRPLWTHGDEDAVGKPLPYGGHRRLQ